MSQLANIDDVYVFLRTWTPFASYAAVVEVDFRAATRAATVGNVSFGVANDATFASRAAVVEADFRAATRDDERRPFGRMIGSTAGVKEDVSAEGSSAGATTIGNVTSGDAGGPDDAAFASCAASVEADFCKATRDDERLPFWTVPEVRGLFELAMAIGNRGLPTYWE